MSQASFLFGIVFVEGMALLVFLTFADIRAAARAARRRYRLWRQWRKRPCIICADPAGLAQQYMHQCIPLYSGATIIPKTIQCPNCGRRMNWPGNIR